MLQIVLNGPNLGTLELTKLLKDAIFIGNKMGICNADGTFGKSKESTASRKMNNLEVNKRKENTEYQKRMERKKLINKQMSQIFEVEKNENDGRK